MPSKDEVIKNVTYDFLNTLNFSALPPKTDIRQELLTQTCEAIELENAVKGKGQSRWRTPETLVPAQIAVLINALEPVCCVACAGENGDSEYDLLAVYQTDGPDRGLYDTNDLVIQEMIREYNFTISTHDIQEVIAILRGIVPHRKRCSNPDYIAVNNGIFDYEHKVLMPFSPDYVFLAKSRVDYNPNITNPVIHNDDDGTDWDVESWMSSLSDDQDIVNVLWEILGAIIRPFVRWNKSAWFYSNTGNNGKGTLCELMRNLCGQNSYASIPLMDFSKDFLLEPLTRASAIIVDENDVGGFIDRAANLKAIITNDVIQINRKFKTPIAYQFYGFMVQCLNEYPRIRDKSDSFYRRQLFVPFEKCFTGRERTYIKADYLHRKEVLEYVLHRVLHMNYYTLSEPQACKDALNEYKGYNDPIRQFAEEMLPQCVWDMLPFGFLYDLYRQWFNKNSPSGSPQGKNTFILDFTNILPSIGGWVCIDRTRAIKPGKRMDKPEPLILQYDLKDWRNPNYPATDLTRSCQPILKTTYKGILRNTAAAADSDDPDFSNIVDENKIPELDN